MFIFDLRVLTDEISHLLLERFDFSLLLEDLQSKVTHFSEGTCFFDLRRSFSDWLWNRGWSNLWHLNLDRFEDLDLLFLGRYLFNLSL